MEGFFENTEIIRSEVHKRHLISPHADSEMTLFYSAILLKLMNTDVLFFFSFSFFFVFIFPKIKG